MAAAHDTPDIAQRLDQLPLTRLHAGVALVCALAMAGTLGELAVSGALSAIFSTGANKASASELSFLLSSVYIGAIVGAPSFGWLADRIGRRSVLVIVLLWVVLTTLAASSAQNVLQLTLCRGLAGLSLGALPPLLIAMMTDVMPPRQRGGMTFLFIAVSGFGPFFTLWFLRWAASTSLGAEAWRTTFILLALLCLLTAAASAWLPESPRFLAVRGRTQRAAEALARFERSPTLLWKGPAPRVQREEALKGDPRSIRLVYALFILSPWATAAFPMLWGAVLTQRGFGLSEVLSTVTLSMIGPMVGHIVSSPILDRIDRRLCLAGCSAVMIPAGILFVSASALWQIMVGVAVFGMAISIYLSTLNLYAAELFPTEGRSRRLSSAWALNRVGAAIGPLVLVPLLRSHGALQMFALIACTLLASLAISALAPEGRQRKAVA